MSRSTIYVWKAKGGMIVSKVQRLKAAKEQEPPAAQSLLADTMLDKAALNELL